MYKTELREIVDEEETMTLDHRELKALRFVGESHGNPERYPLGRCRGDCDNNEECKGSLVCFEHTGSEPVPGCTGTVGVRNKNYQALQQTYFQCH